MAKQVMLKHTILEKGDKVANIRTRVEVTTTDKHPYYKAGVKRMLSPVLAADGIKKGFFVDEAKKAK
jgi:hypothetical protein